MAKREKTTLRNNAAMAKRRLGNGFWNQQHKKGDLENINNPNGEDEQLYRSVVTIMDAGGTNPLSDLLDHDYMRTLDDAARQRYVLNMSNLVNKSLERYKRTC